MRRTPALRRFEQALRTAETALLAGQLVEASTATEQARQLDPQNPRISFLAAQIERELTRSTADSAQREAQETRQTQVRGALASMEQRLTRGALIEPLGDSAVTYYRNAELISPGAPAVLGARDSLVAALLNEADIALDGGKTDAARRLADVAAQINARAPGLELVRRRFESASARPAAAAPPATETARVVAAVTPQPEPANTPAPPAATADVRPATAAPAAATTAESAKTSVVSANKLMLVRQAEARYPQQAFQTQTSGWVEMEFTVATSGEVKDVVVTASEPGRTFDSVAMAALRR